MACVWTNLDVEAIEMEWNSIRLRTLDQKTLDITKYLAIVGIDVQKESLRNFLLRIQDLQSLRVIKIGAPRLTTKLAWFYAQWNLDIKVCLVDSKWRNPL